MIPSSNDLVYFIEVAKLLNLSRAAETLGISQPSLTLAMQRLEITVGTAILIRHKRGVSLTKAGKQLFAHARQLLQYWESLKSQTLASVNDVQGCFTIGSHPTVASYSLTLFLAELLENYPRLEVKLKHDLSRKITEGVISLGIDIGIVVNPVRHPDLVIKKLDDDKVTLWRNSQKHKIQQFQSDQAVILCDPELIQAQTILKQMRKQGLTYARLVPCCSLEVIADLTKNDCGIGILPTKIAKRYDLQQVPKAPTFQDEICLLYRGENRDVKAIQVITEAIKMAFKEQKAV